MSVNSIQLLLFTCAVEFTLLALLTMDVFRPAAMLLMVAASLSFISGLAWEVIPPVPSITVPLSRFANSPKFWFAAVGVIWITALTIRTYTAAGTTTAAPESKGPSS